MKRTITLAIFIMVLALPQVVKASITIKPLEPERGKVLLIYEVKCNQPGVNAFIFPPVGGLTSLDRKPLLASVIEKGTGKKLKSVVEPYFEKGKAIPGKYEFRVQLEKPLQEGQEYVIELKIIIFNKPNCYMDKEGRWVCKYATRHNAIFLVPKGHTPVFSSHPVRIFEDQGIICLQTDTEPVYSREQTLVFKTAPPERIISTRTEPE